MNPWRLGDIARAVGGRLEGEDRDVTAVATDSREAGPGTLFVGLRGEHADGATFAADAAEHGAAGVLVPDGTAVAGPAVFVESAGDALLELAGADRRRRDATVVAVTGANGKTSTKDLLAAVSSERFRTHASPGSSNNEIGLPMTLLGAPADAEVIVAEMGARRAGDVALLCEVAVPDVAVVTNVGLAHIGVFGSWEAIVESSAEPVVALPPGGVAVLNADDREAAGMAGRCRGRVVTFGLSADATVRAEAVTLNDDGLASFDLVRGTERSNVALGVPGAHMVSNALAAAAAGAELGVPIEAAASALGRAHVTRWRMESFMGTGGVRVVNDAYNASPESMAAALKTARWMSRGGKLIAVVGAMAELGPITSREHDRVGELAARLGVDRLVSVGEDAGPIAVAAVREGLPPEDVAHYADPEEALEDVRRHAGAGDVVLFKASRVVGLERLAEAMR